MKNECRKQKKQILERTFTEWKSYIIKHIIIQNKIGSYIDIMIDMIIIIITILLLI